MHFFLRSRLVVFCASFAAAVASAHAGTLGFSQTDYKVNEGDGNVFIAVTLDRTGDADPGATVTVDYKTIPGSATGGAPSDPNRDYTTQDSTVANGVTPPNQAPLTFGPGETQKVIAVPINDDSAVENTESFSVILFNAGTNKRYSVTLAKSTATVTIFDNDSTNGTIGFSSATYSVNENPQNNGGSGSVTLSVTRNGDTTRQVNVNYATSPVTATENVDYQGQSGTLVFNPGETSKQIVIPIFNDNIVEGDETFAVNLSPNFGGISSATVTIVDDDSSTVSFSSSNYSVAENAGNATITLLRSGNTSTAASVSVVTIAGSATADQDYVTTARSVDFAPGQTAATFTVPIIDDKQVEGTESFKISLSARANSGVVIGATSTATVDILDDEGANTVEFAGTDFSVYENEASLAAQITVRLNRGGDPNQSVSVDYFTTTGSATPNQDYRPASGTLTFGPGETFKTFSVPIINDAQVENTETVGLVLANPTNAFLGANSTATLSILDDDSAGTIQFSTANYAVSENSGSVTLTVLLNRTGNTNAPVSVGYATIAGSAASSRFGQTSGTLNFAPGSSVATITVPILNDSTIEPPQSFSVALFNPSNAALGSPSVATVTVQDDDGLNTVEFDAADYGAVETNRAVQVRIRAVRGGDPNQLLSVGIALGAPGDTAVNGVDYSTPSTTTVTFPAGISVQSVTIPITNNPEAQGTKTFTISLTNPGAFTSIGRQSTARVTIFDNSGPNTAQFLTSAVRFREGDQQAIAITVVRFGDFDRHGTHVDYTTEIRPGDTAQEGVNFTKTSGTLEFAALLQNVNGQNLVVDNEHQKSIIIPIPNNTLVQGDVTFHVTLTGSDVAQLGTISSTKVTISDDDLGNVVQFSSPTYSVSEAGGNAILTVNLIPNGDPSKASSVDFAATPVTAFAGFDFSPVTGTVTFAPGETSKTILIPINNDSIPEGSETFRVTLSNPSPGTIVGTPSDAIVTIIDDDVASAIQFSPASYTVSETAGSVTLTVIANRQGNPNNILTVQYQTIGGTATEGADYVGAAGTLTFNAGETQKTITIQILDDNLIESTENFSVVLSAAGTNATLGTSSTATVSIADDDSPTASIGFSKASYDVDEGSGFANLLVTRSGGLGVSATVNYATADGTAKAGVNYTAKTGSITFAVGQVSQVIQIPIIDDPNADPTLQFTVALTAANGTGFVGGQSTATVNIIDNDATTFRFNPSEYTVDEGAGTVTLTVEALRVGDPTEVITVDYVTADGSATAGVKYQRTSGRLTFKAGVSKQTITVPIIDNTTTEGTEFFLVNLSNPQSENNTKGTNPPKLGTPSTATVTIIDNDATTFQFSSGSFVVDNSAGNATVTVTLSRLNNPSGTFSVDFATSDITAVAGRDYTAVSGRLTFGAGETTKTVLIPLTPQSKGEPTRQFAITLSNPSPGTELGQISKAIVSITNFDLSTKLLNISTRGPVGQGTDVMIAGFIVQGSSSKQIAFRGMGPSLTRAGVLDAIADPTLTIVDGNGAQIAFNDDYTSNTAADQAVLSANSLTPGDVHEAAIVATLGPGLYTAILRAKTNGVALVEAYDLSGTAASKLVNISTRGKVEKDDEGAMIAGFIVAAPQNQPGTSQQVVVRAIGPSLKAAGIPDALADTTLEIYRGADKVLENDNWTTNSSSDQSILKGLGLAPSSDKEATIISNLDPGSYTAVVRGKNNTAGVALVEVYQLNR